MHRAQSAEEFVSMCSCSTTALVGNQGVGCFHKRNVANPELALKAGDDIEAVEESAMLEALNCKVFGAIKQLKATERSTPAGRGRIEGKPGLLEALLPAPLGQLRLDIRDTLRVADGGRVSQRLPLGEGLEEAPHELPTEGLR